MGNKLVEKMLPWAESNLKTIEVKDFVKKVLEKADDANAENPASSSGKYHPTSDLGPGGNVRHCILVAECAKILARSYEELDTDFEYDIVVGAALLHDICKYDSKDPSHTNFEHPILAEALCKEVDDDLGKKIGKNIASHMGRWNTSKYSKVVLPLPKTIGQRIVHYADLIAANKELPIIMDKFTKEAEEELKAINE